MDITEKMKIIASRIERVLVIEIKFRLSFLKLKTANCIGRVKCNLS